MISPVQECQCRSHLKGHANVLQTHAWLRNNLAHGDQNNCAQVSLPLKPSIVLVPRYMRFPATKDVDVSGMRRLSSEFRDVKRVSSCMVTTAYSE